MVDEKATAMEDPRIKELDPETEFLCSKRKTQNDWELFKENVKPLKRGRNITILNNALKSHTDNHIKKSLLENRRFSPFSISSTSTVLVPSSLSVLRYSFRKLIEAIDDYKGDDPLQPWLEWVLILKRTVDIYSSSSCFLFFFFFFSDLRDTYPWTANAYIEHIPPEFPNFWFTELTVSCISFSSIFTFWFPCRFYKRKPTGQRCIKWVQEAYPAGGDFSGLVLIYEHCVRTFWHSDRYKEDLRYLKVWLEYVSLMPPFKLCSTIVSQLYQNLGSLLIDN